MKTHLIACFLLLSTTVFAGNPPEIVIKSLKQKFPSAAEIKWKKIDYYDFWEASFKLKDRNTSAVFTSDGHWLYSRMEITFNEIGVEEVKSAIRKDFPECEIISVIINNSLTTGTWYNVKAKCKENIIESDYDYIGLPWPPKE